MKQALLKEEREKRNPKKDWHVVHTTNVVVTQGRLDAGGQEGW